MNAPLSNIMRNYNNIILWYITTSLQYLHIFITINHLQYIIYIIFSFNISLYTNKRITYNLLSLYVIHCLYLCKMQDGVNVIEIKIKRHVKNSTYSFRYINRLINMFFICMPRYNCISYYIPTEMFQFKY